MIRFLQTTAIVGAFMASASLAQAPMTAPAPAAQPAAPAPTDQAAPAAQGAPGAAAGAAAATAATPSADGGVTAGAQVKGPDGSSVGTIESADAQYATVATPKVKVKLPLTAFASRPEGLVIGMTQAQLEAAAGSAGAAAAAPETASATPSGAAAGPAKLEAGATVNDTKGAPVGKIEEVSGDFAVVATAKNKVRLPLTAFANGQTGPVIGMSEAELDAAAEAAAKPQTAAK